VSAKSQSWSGPAWLCERQERRNRAALNFTALLRSASEAKASALAPMAELVCGPGWARSSSYVTKVQFNG